MSKKLFDREGGIQNIFWIVVSIDNLLTLINCHDFKSVIGNVVVYVFAIALFFRNHLQIFNVVAVFFPHQFDSLLRLHLSSNSYFRIYKFVLLFCLFCF